MNAQSWFTLIGICCTVIVTVTTWGFLTGKWSTSEANRISKIHDDLENCQKEMNRRFDEAGKETSKAWTYVQGIETRFIEQFANRELTEVRFDDNRREHTQFHEDLRRLRTKRSTD